MVRLRFVHVLTFLLLACVAPLTIVHQADAQPAAPPTAQAVTCAPGTPITVTGTGPTRAAYLLSFGSRIVSGGSVNAAGRFRFTLVVGRERSGEYPIMVRLRGAPDILLTFTCTVPAVTSATVTTPIQVSAPNSLYTAGADIYNCEDFATYQDADAAYKANLPGDPNRLDGGDNDGIPCESLPEAP